MSGSGWYRGHGLGNDYLVFEAAESSTASAPAGWPLSAETIERLCHRHEGVGGDGIVLLLDRTPPDGVFPLRMFNPDGSEFERSGNGLRVLGSHLYREGLVGLAPFRVRTGGEEVEMQIHGVSRGVYDISVEMGVGRTAYHRGGIRSEALDEAGCAVHPELGPIPFQAVWVGNPHAVVFLDDLPVGMDLESAIETVGPFLVGHPAFPEGTNVQVAAIPGVGRVSISIWERGVGRTSASGTSSCAAALAAVRTGRQPHGLLEVEMGGGVLGVGVEAGGQIILRGPVAEITSGTLAAGMMARLQG